MARRCLIIASGNEATGALLDLRQALVTDCQNLEDLPTALCCLALNTDEPRDTHYPQGVQLREPEKLSLRVANLPAVVQDASGFHHLTQDLPTQVILSQDTIRGSARVPAQGLLSLRFHHEAFAQRLRLILQQLYDPDVPSDADELSVVLIVSGCTGTGRGTALEILIEVKRQLVAFHRPHRILMYVLSPEGLSPEDLPEKQKVFYAFAKELNALALGEGYHRPFLSESREQPVTELPADYVFLVSARSDSVHLDSLRAVKQVIVTHILYELTSAAGTRMESARRDCILRLRGIDGTGQPTRFSRLGIAVIDLPVRVLQRLCLAQGGLDVCELMLGETIADDEEAKGSTHEEMLASAGLSLSQVRERLGQAAALSGLGLRFAKLQEALSAAKPHQWASVMGHRGTELLESLLHEFRRSLPKRLQTFTQEIWAQIEGRTTAQLTDFGQSGVRPALDHVKTLLNGLGLGEEADDGPVPQLAQQLANLRPHEAREQEIRRCRQQLAETQDGWLVRLGLHTPTEARDQLLDAMKVHYQSELTLMAGQTMLEAYQTLGRLLTDWIQRVEGITSQLEKAQEGFRAQLQVYQRTEDFALTESLIPTGDYQTLYRKQLTREALRMTSLEILASLGGNIFALAERDAETFREQVVDVFHESRRLEFLEHLSFTEWFEHRYPDMRSQEEAIRRTFERAVPLTLTDANYPHSKHGVQPEAHQFVLVPQEATAWLRELIGRTYPISQDHVVGVPEKRLLVLREEHGWPMSAVPYLRDECAVLYREEGKHVLAYHITQWAAAYPEPVAVQPREHKKLTAHELLLLALGLQLLVWEEGNFTYHDGPIAITLGTSFEAALETLEAEEGADPSSVGTGESDYAALHRQTLVREQELIRNRTLERVFGEQARRWPAFARPLRDLYLRRYGSMT